MKPFLIKLSVLFFISVVPFAVAELPLVSYTDDTVQQEVLPIEERLDQLEQQMRNLNSAGVLSQLDELHQDMQRLQGRIEVQSHDMKILSVQIRSFYQDLDHRLSDGSNPQKKSVFKFNKNNKSGSEAITRHSDFPEKDDLVYQAAYNLLSDKNYTKAAPAMRDYIKNYPNGRFVGNAHYWLGELHLLKEQTKEAIKEFMIVVNEYQQHPKTADALLKLGVIYSQQGQHQEAINSFSKVQDLFPDSPSARLAETRLREIKRR